MTDAPNKPGRPKGKPLSPAERAQRRVAAIRHGRYATSVLRQAVPACKRSSCPQSFPCDVRRRVVEAGGGLEICVVTLMTDDDVRQRYLDALRDGDTDGLQELAAGVFASLHGLHGKTLQQLRDEGLATVRPQPTKTGDVLEVPMTHPAAFPFLELNKQLGFTGDQQALTPKSRGETKRAVSEADHLAWMRRMHDKTSPGDDE